MLDEFHSYDGAQGTDVAMLIRRLGLALAADRSEPSGHPLGNVTPVATSATLGDGADPATMLGFASTVFGTPFPADAVITGTRQTRAEWTADITDGLDLPPPRLIGLPDADELVRSLTANDPEPDELVRQIIATLYDDVSPTDDRHAIALLAQHPMVANLIDAAHQEVSLALLPKPSSHVPIPATSPPGSSPF